MRTVFTRRSTALGIVVAVALLATATASLAAVPAWTTYRHDASRSGVDPDSTSPISPSQAWQTPALDGSVYGEPLVYGSTVYVATENDTVYALDAATGAIAWQRHVAAAVPSTKLPCGNISPVVGITSTPVIDPVTGAIYVVADTWDGSNASSITHEMYGLSLASGAVTAGPFAVDPPGSTHTALLQRAALALDAGKVIIGFGGNDGDCSTYHGWLAAIPEGGGTLQTYEVDPAGHDGAVWGAGNGPAIDSSGDIWASTGNGDASSFGHQESVLLLDSSLNLLDFWAPSDWSALDSSDTDLGSSAPVLLPGGLVFQIGKQGVGYLLSQTSLGGEGGTPVYRASVCSGSWGGGIYYQGVIYVTCSDGLRALALNATARSFAALSGWNVNGSVNGPPIIAGGLVWAVDWNGGTLYGLDLRTGATAFSANLGAFSHFASASAAGGRLFIANRDRVTAFAIATAPSASSTTTSLASSLNPASIGTTAALTASVSPLPDEGTIHFTDGGVPVAGCSAVPIVSGRATCTTSFSSAGTHSIVAAYSGDLYFDASSSSTLGEVVLALPGLGSMGPRLSHVRVTVFHGRVTLHLDLSEAAAISVAVDSSVRGRSVGRRCRRGARTGRRCRALIRRRLLHLHGRRGENTFRLLRRSHLRRGSYALVLVARDGAGRRSRRAVVSFTVPPHRR